MDEGKNRKVWSLADFRQHSAQYGIHKVPSDWRLHKMKYTPVGVDIAKHLIQIHFINEYTGEVMDMLGAAEHRFGKGLPTSLVEWLTDNGSYYRANETCQFVRILWFESKNTAVRSSESNGIAESFVKTIKRDYISCPN